MSVWLTWPRITPSSSLAGTGKHHQTQKCNTPSAISSSPSTQRMVIWDVNTTQEIKY